MTIQKKRAAPGGAQPEAPPPGGPVPPAKIARTQAAAQALVAAGARASPESAPAAYLKAVTGASTPGARVEPPAASAAEQSPPGVPAEAPTRASKSASAASGIEIGEASAGASTPGARVEPPAAPAATQSPPGVPAEAPTEPRASESSPAADGIGEASAGASTPGARVEPAPAVRPDAPSPPGPGVPAEARRPWSPPATLPTIEEATNWSAEDTTNLMRDVVAYNRIRLRQVIKDDDKWFKNWPDKPVHELQPLTIRRPSSEDELLTYVAAWTREEAVISFQGTDRYKGGANVWWLSPFVDPSDQKMTAIAGDPPHYSACIEAMQTYDMSKIQLQGLTQGEVSAAREARIRFPHSFTTFQRDRTAYDSDHFDGSLPIVSGHVALWGFHLAVYNALASGDMAHVAVLVQAALCAPIEGVIADSDEKLSLISMEIAESARVHHDFMKNTFPAFACKLMLAFPEPLKTASVANKVAYCQQHQICYNGTIVYRSMLLAAQNCYERLDVKAMRTLRYIERHRGSTGKSGSKSDLTTAFNSLNRILQVCKMEVELKANAAMWGSITATDLINHVLDYIAWALDHGKLEGGGVTTKWLETKGGARVAEGCGTIRLVTAKAYVRVFLENAVNDLPDTSNAKKEFQGVLAHFASYEVFARTFAAIRTKNGPGAGASSSAADDDDDEQETEAEDGTQDDVDEPFTKIKERTAPVAVKLLDFMFDLYSPGLDDILSEFLTIETNAKKAVCQIRWEQWLTHDFVEIRKSLNKHRMTVPASENSEVPAASTRGLKRSRSAAGDDEQDGAGDVDEKEKLIAEERATAWREVKSQRLKVASTSYIKGLAGEEMSKEHLDRWWSEQTAALEFKGTPGTSHRVFVLSGERWPHVETSASPWAGEPQSTESLEMVLDWVMERRGPCDTLLLFDGRSASIREMMEKKMKTARNVSEIWIMYEPSMKESGGTKGVFGSRNREMGWVSLPVPSTEVPVGQRATKACCESSTFASTFSGVVPLRWKQLPCIALNDKSKIIGTSPTPPPVPPSKVFDTDLGAPLCWQEVKSKELWLSVLGATKADYVVDLGVGSGFTARACLAHNTPWLGLCWNKTHAFWMNHVLDRWTLNEIVQKKSPLHSTDLARLVNTHFSDQLQQIQDQDSVERIRDDVDDPSEPQGVGDGSLETA